METDDKKKIINVPLRQQNL